MKTIILIIAGGITLIATLSACNKSNSGTKQKLNVLFIAVDDLRPELGCYGKEYMHTPNIDNLASKGRVFRNHFVHCAACGPSRSTLLSGRRTLSWDIFREIRESGSKPDGIFSLPQLFKENGYLTVCIGKISHQPGGVIDSVQKIHEVPYSWNKAYAPVGEWKYPWNAFFSYSEGKSRPRKYNEATKSPFEAADVSDIGYADGLNSEEAIKQLQKLKDTTFFLAVGFYKPHLPFNAPKRYWDLYNPENIPEAVYKELPKNVKSNICLHGNHESYEPRTHYLWPNDTSNYEITKERGKILKHGYCAAVSYIDAQIGKVLDALEELGLDENTIVILWGDHGWQLGEHALWCKHANFKTSLNAPLVIKAPGFKGQLKTKGLVEFIDIYPSLCELAGLSLPDQLHGKSFVPLLKDSELLWENAVYSRFHKGESVITNRYLYTEWFDKEGNSIDRMIFDHEKDPEENINIINHSDLPFVLGIFKK